MKKTLSLLLTATLAAGLLAGCGGAGGASQAAAPADSGAAAEETAADGVAAAEGAATEGAEAEAAPADSKGTGGDKKITVGATPVPHADILDNAVKQVLAEEGWELETMVFED